MHTYNFSNTSRAHEAVFYSTTIYIGLHRTCNNISGQTTRLKDLLLCTEAYSGNRSGSCGCLRVSGQGRVLASNQSFFMIFHFSLSGTWIDADAFRTYGCAARRDAFSRSIWVRYTRKFAANTPGHESASTWFPILKHYSR